MRPLLFAGLISVFFGLALSAVSGSDLPAASSESGMASRPATAAVPESAPSVTSPESGSDGAPPPSAVPGSSVSANRDAVSRAGAEGAHGSAQPADAGAGELLTLARVRFASGVIFISLMVVMLAFAEFDHLHPKKLMMERPVSVVIPCYNDGESIGETISSVFKAYPAALVDLIVVNDCSTDNSLEKIKEQLPRYSFRLVDNKVNKGKARSLNDAIAAARHDFVLCLDADTVLNKQAIHDMLARFEHDERLGAVSCPYRPRNRGFLPAMQAVEYSMLLLTQGAHNIFSAMALWGGCLMVRKKAFDDCGGFNLAAITEDVDLAFQLNRRSWRVEQSFRPVRSIVPDTISGWIRQKLRWTAGGFQCYIRHFRVWIRNPIQIFFIFSYSLFVISSLPQIFESVDFGEDVIELWNDSHTVWQNLVNINAIFGRDIFTRLGRLALCLSFTSVYVFPLIRSIRDIFKLLLVIPYTLIYFPAYTILSFFGIYRGMRSVFFPKKSDTCGWKTT